MIASKCAVAGIFALLVSCFNTGTAKAQEGWQSNGGASAWSAGKLAKPSVAKGSTSSGTTSWIAGENSFGSSAQQGGVWREGSAGPSPMSQPQTKNIAEVNQRAGPASSPAGTRFAPSKPGNASPKSKTAAARTSTSPHFGVSSSSHKGTIQFKSARPGVTQGQHASAGGGHSGSLTTSGTPKVSSDLPNSLGQSLPGATAQPGSGDTMR